MKKHRITIEKDGWGLEMKWYNLLMKTLYSFTIKGNQEDVLGNPIPYHRTTQGSYWNKGSKRYKAWKDYVIKEFCKQNKVKDIGRKPIDTKEKLTMDISIFFANKAHADSSNVFKGIEDALFKNDKYVQGSFKYDYNKDAPRVEVTIKKAP